MGAWMKAATAAWALAIAVLAGAATTLPAAEYTPESPVVQQMVAKGLKFLESQQANDSRLGAKCLIGLAMLKHGVDESHPRIREAVAACKQVAGSGPPEPPGDNFCYSCGIAIIFLCTLDPSQYSEEILNLQQWLIRVQKDHGGWGYTAGTHVATGDTSMTQYAVLSAWEAAQVGFPMPKESIEKVAVWLARTQDPNGGWGYQGELGTAGKLEKQKQVSITLTAAGAGSTYICGDLLGLIERVKPRDEDMPIALREKEEVDPREARSRLDPAMLKRAAMRGNGYMAEHAERGRVEERYPKNWTYYYLYALERYRSFREAAEGVKDPSPHWYNEGVEYLMEHQKDDGSFKSESSMNLLTPDTAFAVLFLLRSTKKSIEKAHNFGAGRLVGGRGLPTEPEAVVVRRGKVVPQSVLKWSEDLLTVLEDADNPEYAAKLDALAELPLEDLRNLTSEHATRLRELAGEGNPEARIAAIRTLAATRSLDNVPVLIYAMRSSDVEVARAAHDALRKISRRLEEPGFVTEQERDKAVERWKQWYRRIRPNADFEEGF